MVEEIAKVNDIDNASGTITVEIQRQSTCGNCSVQNGCGTAVIGKVLGNRRSVLRVNYAKQDVRVGDTVVLGLSERALVSGSLAVYAVPLLLMISFAVLGHLLSEQFPIWDADNISVVFALLGLFFGIIWLKRFTRLVRDKGAYQPIVLRKKDSKVC